MDSLEKWHAHFVDLKTLLSYWEARQRAGLRLNKRSREIFSICIFTLSLENTEGKRFLVGFPQRGHVAKPALLYQLFEDGFGEIEDWDVILISDLGVGGPRKREIHQCQLVSYLNRVGGTDDLIAFLEEKKLKRSPQDNDLRLIVMLDQPTEFDWVKLSIHLQIRRPKCPFSQVFLIGQAGTMQEPNWICWQLFPRALRLKDLDLNAVRRVIAERTLVVGPPGGRNDMT